MADNKNYISNQAETGEINISEDVIAAIAALAAKEVEGVAGLYTSSSVDFMELLGKKSLSKGVRIEVEGKSVTIFMGISICYGTKIPDAVSALQKAVITAVEAMTGLHVTAVNVGVGNVEFPASGEIVRAEPQD